MINTIYDTAYKLKYPKSLINKALQCARKTFATPSERPRINNNSMLILPYHSNFDNLVSMFKKVFAITIIFRNSDVVKTVLIKNSPNSNGGCIYKIPCADNDKFYVGLTGKSLQVRIKQHKNSIKYAQNSNAIFLHVRDFDHSINFNNSTIYKKVSNWQSRNLIESCIIKELWSDTMNTSSGLFTLDPYVVKKIYDYIVPK